MSVSVKFIKETVLDFEKMHLFQNVELDYQSIFDRIKAWPRKFLNIFVGSILKVFVI